MAVNPGHSFERLSVFWRRPSVAWGASLTTELLPSATVAGEPRAYGACDFEVGPGTGPGAGVGRRVAEPANRVRGELARAMLYMAERYGVDVRMTPAALRAWHRADPPDAWELERARRIAAATGLRNPWIGTP